MLDVFPEFLNPKVLLISKILFSAIYIVICEASESKYAGLSMSTT